MKNLNLSSTGMISTQAAVPHARVLKAIEDLGIEATVTLNGIPYFDPDSVERIHEHAMQRRSKRRDPAAAFARRPTAGTHGDPTVRSACENTAGQVSRETLS